jgi:hypothetical protein
MDERSRELKKAWKAEQQRSAEANLPIAKARLLDLFQSIEVRLEADPCDHSLRHTQTWAVENGIDFESLRSWAEEFGGFCDCEVVANVPSSNPAFKDL